jgi:hypothetical protein
MLQKINTRLLAIRSLVLTALCATLFAFSVSPGGDSFSVYIDNTLLLDQHVSRNEATKTIPLNENSGGEMLKVYYSHCGKVGTGRDITIRDGQNKPLKTWNFPDSETGASSAMSCRVKDILTLQKTAKTTVLSLVYASKELPEGKVLARIATGNNDKASLK